MEILCGDAKEVIPLLKPIDCTYTCPSPYRYYEDEITGIIGSEVRLDDYLNSLMGILDACWKVTKDTGSLFLQINELFNLNGGVYGMPVIIENKIRQRGTWFFANRLFWYRTESRKVKYEERGFLKNYEYIFHLVKNPNKFYFNTKSKYSKTSVFSYPLEDSYYTNEFDSGLPYQLSEMVIDTCVPKDGTILDPLAGSGKLGVVAKKMNRNAILIDIDPKIVELMKIRLSVQ